MTLGRTFVHGYGVPTCGLRRRGTRDLIEKKIERYELYSTILPGCFGPSDYGVALALMIATFCLVLMAPASWSHLPAYPSVA